MAEDTKLSENINVGLKKILEQHGYGFHYAVLAAAQKVFATGGRWVFEAAEVPVQANGYDTRIDFILTNLDRPYYLIAECKRANPAVSHWCFVRAPFVRRDFTRGNALLETVKRNQDADISTGTHGKPISDPYDIALELKTGEKGDSAGKGRGAIEEAATQVCRGMNGLVELFGAHVTLLKQNAMAILLPVIFTTATIWCSDIDLATTDLSSGVVDLKSIDAQQKPWIWYRYHQSPGLRHAVRSPVSSNGIGQVTETKFARTIAVVSARAVDSFLRES
jgi:hypothetical protein